jgi:hypothetical protein
MLERLQLYSVPAEHLPMVSRLLILRMSKTLKERRILLQHLEDEGWDVRFVHDTYEARKAGGETFTIPPRKCPSCGTWKTLKTFISIRGVEHPWCAECRFHDPGGAEQVRAELASRVLRHQPYDDVLGIDRCKNPTCPHGGIIPPVLLRRGHSFCSPECKALMSAARKDEDEEVFQPCENPQCPTQQRVKKPARFCSKACRVAVTYHSCQNPTCPRKQLVPPRRKYCSRACHVEHNIARGTYHDMSEIGVQRIHDYIQVMGEVPHAAERSEAVRTSNQEAPPRKKMLREGWVNGHLVRFVPEHESGLYRAQVDGVPTIDVTAPTKKQARQLVAKALRDREREMAS